MKDSSIQHVSINIDPDLDPVLNKSQSQFIVKNTVKVDDQVINRGGQSQAVLTTERYDQQLDRKDAHFEKETLLNNGS